MRHLALPGGSAVETARDAFIGGLAVVVPFVMSRTQAKQDYWGGDVQDDLREHQQVSVKAESGATIAEEAPACTRASTRWSA